MEAKQAVRALLDRLPDDCSLEDVLYQLYVLRSIELGEADADGGRVITHEQVASDLRHKGLLGAR